MAIDETKPAVMCSNPDCRIAETGKCVEGLEPGKCAHYGRPITAHGASGNSDAANSPSHVNLPGSSTLSIKDAERVLRAGASRLIAIVGPTDAGKTSLIAAVYDLFQTGNVGDMHFARCRTLQAFEQLCHDARMVSRRVAPHMKRTPRGQVQFFHLAVKSSREEDAVSLLIGDRAGEEYRTAADDVTVTASFPEVARADVITVLVDGDRLQDTAARHNVMQEATMLLQALADGDVLRRGQRLALVLTKNDLVLASKNRAQAERDFAALAQKLEQLFGTLFAEFRTFAIAALPTTNGIARGQGVDKLLEYWLQPAVQLPTAVLPKPSYHRLFARFGEHQETI